MTETIERIPIDVEKAIQSLPKAEFHIDSEKAANWLLRKLANIDAEKARVAQQAEAILADLERERNSLMHLFGAELEAFCRAQLTGKRKTIHFLQGTCAFRTVNGGLKLSDPSAALSYARCAQLPAIETLEKLDSAKYRELAESAMQTTGELLPGMELTEARENFAIKFGKPEKSE